MWILRHHLKNVLKSYIKTTIRNYYDVSRGEVSGWDHIRNPRFNKSLAFTLEERQTLGLHGILPPCFKTQEEQLELLKHLLDSYKKDINKYLFLMDVYDQSEKLFYRFVSDHIHTLLPIIYTPTVGLACQKYGMIYRRPRGMFISINDRCHCFEILKNWPEPNVKAIVVTDGERILGLGDLGACGMGIPVGKLALYTVIGGIKPHFCLPVLLDCGTNNETYLEDPLYIGIRKKRVCGDEYDEFIDEFMKACVKRFGQKVLIQFEDFGNHNAFRLLDKYRCEYCTFNDDIQGTASVSVAGLLASTRISGVDIKDYKLLFLGAGEAASGIAELTTLAMEKAGLPIKEAQERIWMFDIDGLLTTDRPDGSIHGPAVNFLKKHGPTKDFKGIIDEIKPTCIIGASAAPKTFTPEILKAMATYNKHPVIFALSNPTAKAECTAEEAYQNTDGRAIFASGSPFGVVKYKDRTFSPGQGNNAYIFPGVALGILLAGIYHVSDELFLIAAEALAEIVSEEDLKKGRIYPSLTQIKECSIAIAERIMCYAYEKGIATTYPEPDDYREFIKENMYNYSYRSALPPLWDWPKAEKRKLKPIKDSIMLKDVISKRKEK